MIRIFAPLLCLAFAFSACKKEAEWEKALQKLNGTWKVTQYLVDGQALSLSQIENLRFAFELCDMPKYTYCNGTFTNNNQQEFIFAYKVDEAQTQMEINFAALQYENIQAQWQAEKNKHILTFTDNNNQVQSIILSK